MTLDGTALTLSDSEVLVGGVPCTEPTPVNGSRLRCLTGAIPPGEKPERLGPVSVTFNGVQSACLAPPVLVAKDPPANATTAAAASNNCTASAAGVANATCLQEEVRDGCEFQYSPNVTHTPLFARISPPRGRHPDVVTIAGAGFHPSFGGNAVRLGYKRAQVLAATDESLVVAVPRHVGGTYRVSVSVEGKGRAVGEKLAFRFESGITAVNPPLGSAVQQLACLIV